MQHPSFFFLTTWFMLSSLYGTDIPSKSIETERAATIKERYEKSANIPGAALFTPPEGWLASDPDTLPPHVHGMVVGPAKSFFPPSINLGTENFLGSETEFLERIRKSNDLQGFETKDLGKIRTQAGNAHLIQVDTKSEWGDLRLMQAFFLKEGIAYILTAAALRDEFSAYYKEFFQGIRSFRINPPLLESLASTERKNHLKKEKEALFLDWEEAKQQNASNITSSEVFHSPYFQEKWSQFEEKIEKEYQDLGREWLAQFLEDTENALIAVDDSAEVSA